MTVVNLTDVVADLADDLDLSESQAVTLLHDLVDLLPTEHELNLINDPSVDDVLLELEQFESN